MTKLYEQLNELWERVAEYLKDYQCPKPAQVPIEVDGQAGWLGLGRALGQSTVIFSWDDEEGMDWKPITSCGVSIRIAAIPYIEALEKEIIKVCRDFQPVISKAIEDLQKFLRSRQLCESKK